MITAYLAAYGFADQLQEALRRARIVVRQRHERLFVCDGEAIDAAWAANIWHDCVELPAVSIGGAAQALRAIQRNWAMYAPLHHRLASLIQERLPHVAAKPVVFPAPAPVAPSSRGSRRPRRDCTTTCSRSRSPTNPMNLARRYP
jgi:23S rRNA (cytidine2498-2'-O)-methyltransferase